MTIWFASGNHHKKKELSDILSPYSINIKIPSEAGIEFNPEESGTSFLENAMIKAKALYDLVGEPVIADDSGLCVDALEGRPGIHSAYYGGEGLSSIERNALVLSELGDNPNRGACFVCAMVLYYAPNRFFIAQEPLFGNIVKDMESARGSGGFGYDPILYISEYKRTVAELTEEEKNRISHRGRAGIAIGRLLG
ncbi:MAG: RdgB/HAM1 family non-canonical purine NTP pyrophosphatase [Treponema sp.]|nr:RdgB/HAM1 family non-canonical purine NTP pyrophosphatase [Treponema sp.]